MTPFDASMSGWITWASLTLTPNVPSTFTGRPAAVLTCSDLPATSAAFTRPGTTWYFKMVASLALFLSSDSTVPGGSLAKAASLGANTVYGPLPFSVLTRPAAFTAVTSVLKDPAATAVSTISAARATLGPSNVAASAAPAASERIPECIRFLQLV